MDQNKKQLIVYCIFIFIAATILRVNAEPVGVSVEFNETQNYSVMPAASITTAGGTFTTLKLNTTTQTMRWKAYAGNISGKLTLDDGANYTIYDWSLALIAGEVYASRNSSINWANVNCSNRTHIYAEENAMNISWENADSINKTFINTIHKQFVTGNRLIINSTCPAIATYINDTSQAPAENATFQEIMLYDGSNILYSTIIEPGNDGFNRQKYNFQLILPEKGIPSAPTTYYFFAELG
jgi:hypothetical protein